MPLPERLDDSEHTHERGTNTQFDASDATRAMSLSEQIHSLMLGMRHGQCPYNSTACGAEISTRCMIFRFQVE